MPLECDFALLGTGIAPLLAAQSLLRQGYSVLLLNGELDYFREDSELSFDPLLPQSLLQDPSLESLRLHRLERARAVLAPEFPGALEEWPRESRPSSTGAFRDPSAPYLRTRQWNWIPRNLDDVFLRFLDSGWNPQSSQGIAAARRFPGYNWQRNPDSSLLSVGMDRLIDVDLDRYRHGILEFVRSRVTSERMLTSVSSLEVVDKGLRFLHRGGAVQAKVSQGLWVFWTPRMTSWLEKYCAGIKQEKVLPQVSLQGWEEWSLRSREAIDPSHVGFTEDAVAWARVEGEPGEPRMELNVMMPSASSGSIAGAESFTRLSRFIQSFLNWDRFRIRDLKTRLMLNIPAGEWNIPGGRLPVRVMSGCEGALVGVVDRTMKFSAAGEA